MQVLMISGKPLPAERATGIGVSAYNLSSSLASLGLDVTLLCRTEHRPFFQINKKGLKIYGVNHFSIKAPSLVRKIMLRAHPDIVHFQTISDAYPCVFLSKLVFLRSIVIHAHGIDLRIPPRKLIIYKICFSLADVVMAVSNSVKHYLSGYFRLKNIETIPNGVDSSLFRPLDKGISRKNLHLTEHYPIILSAGYVTQRKGLHCILQAMSSIIELYPKAFYIHVGRILNEEYFQRLMRLIEVYGIQRHCKFVGYKESLVEYYNAADVVVVPSLSEAFGLVLFEAMACRKAVITSNIPIFREVIVNGENGIVVDVRKADALSSAIVHVLSDEKLQKRVKRNARKTAEEFSWIKSAEKTMSVYARLQ